jgi:hypothetical protein
MKGLLWNVAIVGIGYEMKKWVIMEIVKMK